MFPFDGMPELARNIAEALPLTHFNRPIRGVVLRGAELKTMLNDVLALVAMMVVMLSLAIRRFSKRLD